MITLNLVSTERKRALEEIKMLAHVKIMCATVIVALAIAYGYLFAIQNILESRLAAVRKDITALEEQLPRRGANSVDENIKKVNEQIQRFTEALQAQFTMTPFMNELSAKVGNGIHMENITVNAFAKQLGLKGVADTRNDLLAFQNALIELPYVDAINTPLSTFTQREDIPFDLSLTLLTEQTTESSTP